MNAATKDYGGFCGYVFRILRRAGITAALPVVLGALNGCSSGLGLWPVAQSHLAAEGTQIVPLGDTRGTAGDFFISWGGLPDFLHSGLQAEAVQEAIRIKKAIFSSIIRSPSGPPDCRLGCSWLTSAYGG